MGSQREQVRGLRLFRGNAAGTTQEPERPAAETEEPDRWARSRAVRAPAAEPARGAADGTDAGVALDLVREGVTTVLPASFSGVGSLTLSSGGVLLFGEWTGDVTVAGTLIIGRGGHVRGNIDAGRLYVDGTVERGADGRRFQIIARDLIITDDGVVSGDIFCETFTCGKGGRVDGSLQSGA
jgi:cytoskeletal protein CcmA (bactofilin family)